jgi:AGZA family xanthine/uracil permease-like MFS transporter
VESAVGIGAGGRTGLTAIVCGALMLLCFGLAPILHYVPVVATTGVLVFVAIKLVPARKEIAFFGRLDLVVLALMQLVVLFSFALDRAMLVAFSIYLLSDLKSGRRVQPALLFSSILLLIGVALQM